jgi:hypothetical protein
MVDTTISPPVQTKPPFRDPPLDAAKTAFSDTWVAWFTDTSDRLALLTQRVGIAEGDIAAGGGGVTDGSDAPAGHIGEYLSNTGGSVGLTSAATANIVSLNLSAGDWDVSGNVVFSPSAGTNSFFGAGIGGLDAYLAATFAAGALNQALNTATRRYNVTAATTVWVVARAVFTGTCTASGTVRARRTR